EPTAVLTPQEINELIDILQFLIKEGKSIIMITHKLKEMMKICDRCTVIRKGTGIGTVNVDETTVDELTALMVGRNVTIKTEKTTATSQEIVLEVQQLHVKDIRKVPVVKGMNFNVRKNEIVGIAGVDGNGQTELIEAIAGLRKIESGTISLNDERIDHLSPRKITEKDDVHLPQVRHMCVFF